MELIFVLIILCACSFLSGYAIGEIITFRRLTKIEVDSLNKRIEEIKKGK